MTIPFYSLLGLGFIAGISSGVFGIGGGIILVPAMVLLFKLPTQSASGTSLVALLLPVGILGVWQYFKSGALQAENFRYGLWIAGGMFVGAYFGAKIAVSLSSQTLSKAMAIFLVLVAFKLWMLGK